MMHYYLLSNHLMVFRRKKVFPFKGIYRQPGDCLLGDCLLGGWGGGGDVRVCSSSQFCFIPQYLLCSKGHILVISSRTYTTGSSLAAQIIDLYIYAQMKVG